MTAVLYVQILQLKISAIFKLSSLLNYTFYSYCAATFVH